MITNKVLTYHTNVLTCGVAKFNSIMASFLKVDCIQIFDKDAFSKDSFPMISVKIGEFLEEDKKRLTNDIAKIEDGCFDLFLHGYDEDPLELIMIKKARKVFTGNVSIASRIKMLRSDIKELWCPGMNLNNTEFEKTDIKLLTFGMAHKLRVELYYKLKEILDRSQRTYSLYISTALHEGTAFEESFLSVYEEISNLFGNKAYFLGYMSDQGVFNYLKNSDYFVSFFQDGFRANNTSVNYSLSLGIPTITNLDKMSPSGCVHMKNILDIHQLETLEIEDATLESIKREAQHYGREVHGWERLIKILRK